jgi:hypothetical protein
VHVKTAKEELIRKVKQLEQFNALQKRDHEQLKGEHAQLQEKVRTFVEQMKEGAAQPYQDLINTINQPSPYKTKQSSTGSIESLDNDVYATSEVDMESDEGTADIRWTTVTNEVALVDHLMLLYFTWVHPVHMLFHEGRFVSSLQTRNLTYCTPSLVNAICAMGCCFMADEQGNNEEAIKLRQRFVRQAHAELKVEDEMTPVSSVTYAIIFLVELSAGQARTAISHLRLAVESLRQVDKSRWSEEAFEISSFGLHTMNT